MDSNAIAVGTQEHNKEYSEEHLHFDVNGAWGGRRAVVAHFSSPHGPHGEDQMFLYILVGSYGEVASLAGQKQGVTPWEVARLLTKALQDGVDPNVLYHTVHNCTHPDVTALERALSRVYYSAQVHGPGYTIDAMLVQLGRLAAVTIEGCDRDERAYRLEQIAAIATRMLSQVIDYGEE